MEKSSTEISSGKEMMITEKVVVVSYVPYQFFGTAVRALSKCLGFEPVSSTSTTQEVVDSSPVTVTVADQVENTPPTAATTVEQVDSPLAPVAIPEAPPAASTASKRPRFALRAARPDLSTGSGAQTN